MLFLLFLLFLLLRFIDVDVSFLVVQAMWVFGAVQTVPLYTWFKHIKVLKANRLLSWV